MATEAQCGLNGVYRMHSPSLCLICIYVSGEHGLLGWIALG